VDPDKGSDPDRGGKIWLLKSKITENNGYVVLNKISRDQPGNRVAMRGKALDLPPHPFYTAGFKTDIL
jgi:hypothetical protein